MNASSWNYLVVDIECSPAVGCSDISFEDFNVTPPAGQGLRLICQNTVDVTGLPGPFILGQRVLVYFLTPCSIFSALQHNWSGLNLGNGWHVTVVAFYWFYLLFVITLSYLPVLLRSCNLCHYTIVY
jgi:hypothetical protein